MATDEDVPDHDVAFAASRGDRDRTLRAIHRLEAALSMAVEGRTWLSEVTADLTALETAMAEEQRELNRPDSLLAMIVAEHPRRFGPRERSLRDRYDDIVRQLASLRDQLAHGADSQIDANDLRHRAGWIIRSLHHCRAQQTDLVYTAVALDLGRVDP